MTDQHWDSAIAKATLSDPFFWIFAIQYFLMTNSLNAFGCFAPTIVASLGFKGYHAQLMTVPPKLVAMVVIAHREQIVLAGLEAKRVIPLRTSRSGM
jgi:hypothetical protein